LYHTKTTSAPHSVAKDYILKKKEKEYITAALHLLTKHFRAADNKRER